MPIIEEASPPKAKPAAPPSDISSSSPPPPPPPADAERVTPCGGVLKSVLKEGEEGGSRPPLHSRCLVHYEGHLRDSGETFFRSAEEGRGTGEPAVVVAGRDASLRATGLNMAVLAMRRGEKARVWIEDPRTFGYGERGSFSFPAVPPLAKLVYDIELVAFEPPEDDSSGSEEEEEEEGEEELGKETGVEGESNNSDGSENPKKKKKKKAKKTRPPRSVGSLTYEERLEAATRRKLRGNALLTGAGESGGTKAKDPAAALSQYQLALSYLDDDFLFQLEGPHLEAASELARAAKLNCAAARLALGDARGAAADASEVLKERPRDAKALFRRGKAKRALGDARGAVEDLARASRELLEKDPGVLRELAAAEAEARASEAAGDEVFRRAFAKSVGKGLFSKEEEEKEEEKKEEEKEEEKKEEEEEASLPPFAFEDDDENAPKATGEAAPGSSQAKSAAALLAPLAVFLAVAVLAVAAAVARWAK